MAKAAFDYGQSISAQWLFSSHISRGSIAHYLGNLDEACAMFRRGLEMEKPTYISGQLAAGLFWTLAAKGDPEAETSLARALRYLPQPGRPLSIGSCGSLAFVVEGLAFLGRREEIRAFSPNAEWVVEGGPLCTYSQHLFRTSAGIAAACDHSWARAENHHQLAIHQADTAPYRPAQANARFWYAEMLLSRNSFGDLAHALGLLTEAANLYISMGMVMHARRASALLMDR